MIFFFKKKKLFPGRTVFVRLCAIATAGVFLIPGHSGLAKQSRRM